MERDLCKLLDWFEEESSLWVLLLTGKPRALRRPGPISLMLPPTRQALVVSSAPDRT